MITIKDQLLMVNDKDRYAIMGYLHQQLERGFHLLNEMQQTPTCHESKEAFDRHDQVVEDNQMELDRIAREIHLALTGKKATIKRS